MQRLAALEKKQSKDNKIKNMTDEELDQAIRGELGRMGIQIDGEITDSMLEKIIKGEYP